MLVLDATLVAVEAALLLLCLILILASGALRRPGVVALLIITIALNIVIWLTG